MYTRNFSFFILDGEIDVKDGPVSIVVDHATLMSIVYLNHWDSLGPNEKNFAAWYQDQILIHGLLPSPCFIVESEILDQYDQDKLCSEIMDFVTIMPIEQDDELF